MIVGRRANFRNSLPSRVGFTQGEPARKIGVSAGGRIVDSPCRLSVTDALRDTLQTLRSSFPAIERELGGGGMSRAFVAADVALAGAPR